LIGDEMVAQLGTKRVVRLVDVGQVGFQYSHQTLVTVLGLGDCLFYAGRHERLKVLHGTIRILKIEVGLASKHHEMSERHVVVLDEVVCFFFNPSLFRDHPGSSFVS
jgi:hypothetical protein